MAMSALPAAAGDTPPLMMTPGNFGVSAMGAATYTIPIIVPPGTAGMAPALSIDYSSQNADGTLGLGWVLGGLASITRCARTVAQDNVHGGVNFDNNDRYCMEGQRLVLTSGTYGGDLSQYRTEIDSFAEIIAHGSAGNGPQWFEVHTKAGQILQFGDTTDSRVLTVSAANGAVGPTARTWLVNQISDTRGNYLKVTYTNDTTNGQAYPTEIDYTGNANSNANLTPYNSVKFSYETRPDIVPTYQAGALMQLTVLLTDIKTYAGSSMVFDYKLGYKLAASGAYHDELQTVTQYDNAGHNLPPVTIGWQGGVGLPSMTTINYNAVAGPNVGPGPGFTSMQISTGLFPGDFNADGITDVVGPWNSPCSGAAIWLGSGGGNFTTTPALSDTYYTDIYGDQATQTPACFTSTSTMGTIYGAMDIAGDGFSDVLTYQAIVNGNVINLYHNNRAQGLIETESSGTPLNLAYPLGVFGDFNGDGMPDYFWVPSGGNNYNGYIQPTTGTGQYYIGNGAGTFTAGSTITFGTSNEILTSAVYAADFDGGGCSDLLTQGPGAAIIFSPYCNSATPSVAIPNWMTPGFEPYTQIVLGDFNGDGKTDVLVVVATASYPSTYTCGAAALYLSTGTGLVQSSFTVPSDWCKYQIVAGDFNGDGKTDIALVPTGQVPEVYGAGTPVSIWLSTGTGFVEATTISNSASEQAGTAADWGSDGAADLWLAESTGSDPLYHFNYTPELVTSISNGAGSTTTVQYNPLNTNSTFYTKGTTETYPTQDVDGPIYVVSAVTRSNGIGGTQTTTYAYAGAEKDLSGRGFLGFSQITQSTPAEPYITSSVPSATIVQTTNYGLSGANGLDFPFTGMVSSQTKVAQWPSGSVTLSSTTNAFQEDFLPVGLDGVKRYFMAVSSSTTQSNDLNGAAYPSVTTTHTFDCDSNPTNTCYGDETVTALTRTDNSSSTTHNTYTDDGLDWLLGRVSLSTVENIVPLPGNNVSDIIRTKSSCYDTTGSICRDPNSVNPSGLLMQETVEPGVSDVTQISTTTYTYDPFGNKTKVAVTACVWSAGSCTNQTRTTTTSYSTNDQFPNVVTNDLLETETWVYNASFGVPTSHTGPNLLPTSWTQDTFGRQIKEVRPDSTESVTSYLYCSGTNGGSASCPTYGAYLTQSEAFKSNGTTQIGPIGIAYRDGLSRPIAADTQGFDGGGSPPWIRVSTQYNSFGHVSQTSRPYFVTGGTPAWTVNAPIDALGRPILATNPDTGSVGFLYNALTVTKTEYGYNPVTSAHTTEVTTTVKNAEGLVDHMIDANNGTTYYVYDAFGDVLTTTDPTGSNTITETYDTIGRKLTSHDPDLGAWSYNYDGFGELYQQTDAKSQTTTMIYDVLGRVVERDEADMKSYWTFGIGGTSSANNQTTYPHSIDKLVLATCAPVGTATACTTGGSVNYSRTIAYDSLSRQIQLNIAWGTANQYTTTAYDANTGRITTVRAFSGFKSTNVYTNLGYLSEITDASSGFVYWQATARDAELHLIQQTLGSVLNETQVFDPNSGRVENIYAGPSQSVANFSYSWDTYANLVQRADTINNVTENFCYDALNRLTNYGINGSSCTTGNTNSVKTVSYDSLGDILTKSDVGTYSYPTAGSARPHAVSSISTTTGCTLVAPEAPCVVNGQTTANYTYDPNGNMLTGPGRAIAYTASNMTEKVTQGTTSYTLTYDPEHNRVTQNEAPNGASTWYLNDPVSNVVSERYKVGGVTTYHTYFVVDGKIVAERFTSGSTVTLNYFVLDHLGSVSVIADSTGTPLSTSGRLAYDAWGKARYANSGADDTTCSLPPQSPTTRGFTNQEQMEDLCLDNYNARIYDPQIGRFMAADTVIPDAGYSQSYNRYTYVENGPLSYEDPTGNVGFRLSGPTMGLTVETWTITTGPYSQYSISIVTADDGLVWKNSTQTGITGGIGSPPAGLNNSSSGSQSSSVVTTPATSSQNAAPSSDPLSNTPMPLKNNSDQADPQHIQDKDSKPTLSYRTVGGGRGQKNWAVQWIISGNDSNGIVAQKVVETETITHADGTVDPLITFTKWEAWPVLAGHPRPDQTNPFGWDDNFEFTDVRPSVAGDKITTTDSASAAYYPNYDSVPPPFHRGAATQSGVLYSTTEDPHLPTNNASAPVQRTDPYVNNW
jgi:RHS repeat-associated protein